MNQFKERVNAKILLLLLIIVSQWTQAQQICELPSTKAKSESININTTSVEELSSKLKGIGKAKAAAIIEWRETNGKFQSLKMLMKSKVLVQRFLEKK